MEPIYIANIVGKNQIIVFGPADEGGPPPNDRVKYSSQRIRPDDTIETIKRKILVELPSVSYDELYLFASVQPFLTVERAIHLLTCGHRFPISRHRLVTLCQNLKSPHLAEQLCASIGSNLEKTDYTADELSQFLLAIQNSEDLRLDAPLGETLQYNYPLPADPFQSVLDPFLKKTHPDLVKTQNKTVLLEYGVIHENVINVCCAADVLAVAAATNADDANNANANANAEKIKLYFPYLHERGILSREQLTERRQELLDDTRNLIDDTFLQHNAAVEMLYQVHDARQNPAELRYAERGVKTVHFIMRPVARFTVPLDSLFKVLNSAQQTPLIKYNPQGQREKVYRMYAPGVAKNGNRIPALTKAKVVRLDGEIGKRRRVAVYMERRIDGFVCEVVCEFDAEANVHVKANFRRALQYDQAYNNTTDRVLRECLNPVLDEARNFLQSTGGNSIERFCSIAVPTVEIMDLTYAAYLTDTPMIRLQNIMGCVSSVFTVIDETGDELSMRYKRVSNYDERFGAEAYIAERMRKDATVASIVSGLVKNRLVKTEEAAMQRIADYRAEEQVLETARRRGRTRVKQPGFLTVLRRENTELHIEISDITQVWYLRLLEIYLDAIIRIAMYRDRKGERTTRVPLADLERLCAKRAKRAVAELKELNEDVVEEGTGVGSGAVPVPVPVPEFVADLSFEDRIALERAQERETQVVGAMGAEAEEDEYAGLGDVLDIMGSNEDGSQGSSGSQSGGAPRKKAASAAAAASEVEEEAEEDEAEEEEEEGEEGERGKAYAPQSLKNPNPFEHKLQKSEPILFLSKKTGNYDTYSTNCQSNIKRQPVVLSKQEYDRLHADPEMRPMLKDALEYGSDPDSKYYYMCPRYWSFKDRRPMTEQEVKDKHLERHVIGKKDKEVTLDKYIFEFNDYGKEHMGAKGYIPHYPGFLNPSVHPNGLCVPCCFKKKQQFADLNACEDKLRVAKGQGQGQGHPNVAEPVPSATAATATAATATATASVAAVKEPVMAPAPAVKEPGMAAAAAAAAAAVKVPPHKAPDEYIVGPDKFPIPMGRRGHLPQAVQRFLNYDNSTCQVSHANKTLKKGVKCLLRNGVQEWDKDAMGRDEKPSQLSELQSFIACMASLRQDPRPKTIVEMKQIILDGITLDSFLTYQNGTLVDAFKPAPGQEKEVHASASIYNKTSYVQKMRAAMKVKSAQTRDRMQAAMSNTINSYENFRSFIASNDSVIDHTYMWDIFTTFNPKIFTQKVGFNLIILEVPKDDNSDALNIICPSNHYSNNFFDVRKMTVVLIKQYNYYEPVFQFTDNDDAKKTDVKTSFSLLATSLMPNLKVMIELIKDTIFPGCDPLHVPGAGIKRYAFKYNISASEAMAILKRHNIVVNELVLNYDSKIIGLVAEKRTADRLHSGIVMTAASPLDADMMDTELELVMMDDPDIWSSYADTLAFLAFVHKETKGKIPCLPRIKVVDDAHLIGIMTETNQFMEIRPHIPESLTPPIKTNPPLDIIAYNTTNPHAADAAVQTGASGEDKDRVRYVQRIHLETEMYDMFRNSMRIMINKIKNIEQKKRLEDIVLNGPSSSSNDYHGDIREIMRICREMGDPAIHFTMMQDAVLDAFISEHRFKSSSTAFMRCISAENRIEYGANSCMRAVNPVGGECTIILPQKNLINGIDNRTFYYGKLADELLRYTRLRRFILSGTSSFTSLTPIQYNLNDDEIILFHSQLDAYFENLEPGGGSANRFARYNTFFTANPELNPGEIPSNQYKQVEDAPATGPAAAATGVGGVGGVGGLCAPVAVKPLSGRAAVHYFPASMKLLSFENAAGECTYDAFLSILREENAEYADTSVRELKIILVSKYEELMRTHKVQMMNYHKHLTANRMVLAANAENFIMNTFHYMTHLDLWFLAQHFRIPIVLFSAQQQHPLVENKAPALVLYHDAREKQGGPPEDASNLRFYFVMTLGRLRDVAPAYSIVRNDANEMKFPLSQCTNDGFVAEIMKQLTVGVIPVSEFVAAYVPAVKKRVELVAAAADAAAADAADAAAADAEEGAE